MKIIVTVQPNAKQEKLELLPDGSLKVRVSARPIDNRANEAVVRMLALHFDIPPSSITLVKGTASRHKVFEALL